MASQDKPRRRDFKLPVKSDKVERFYPLLEALANRDELNEVLKNRVAKACQLLDGNIPLYPNDFVKTSDIGRSMADHDSLDEEALQALETVFSLAGRIVAMRSFGKVAFFHLQDTSGRMQCYASREDMGEEVYAVFKKFDIGDIVGVTGKLFRTKTGELTLACATARLLSKSCLL